ncbi:adhesion G-protein coupled receptor G6 isoform X3 [Takifugu flavidus]|uniref:adhesion G-protein coupled receptor G6 isoform X3 n=1 Tax=Takifugu flavidus TaxID=433684 RepID=UPI002544D17E|nr:adhesion G-protein coupled receptor G6 isoform X3 [Takifugu flavidus]
MSSFGTSLALLLCSQLSLCHSLSILADVFFRVDASVRLSGSLSHPQEMIERWATRQLQVNNTMVVVNFIVKGEIGRTPAEVWAFNHQWEEYECCFHVQEYNINSVAETQALIRSALVSKYEDGAVSLHATALIIRHIEPQNCLEDTLSTVYGEYIWSETFPQIIQEMGCRKPRSKRAYRLCKLHIENDETSWAPPDMTACKVVVSFPDLDNVTVTPDNADEVVEMIQDLVDDKLELNEELSATDLDTVVEKLVEVVNIGVMTPPVGENIVTIVSDILLSSTDVAVVANTVLNLTDAMGNNMEFEEESVNFTVPLLAMSMIDTGSDTFTGLTFGVSAVSADLTPQIFLNRSFVSEPLPDTAATISLPSDLEDFFSAGEGNKTRIQFHFYGSQKLFQDPLITNVTGDNMMLNSYIVSASIKKRNVNNLREHVLVTFRHLTPKDEEDKVHCVFWDFYQSNGRGGWNSEGCETHSVSPSQTSCRCNHLTHFGVLLDVSREAVSDADSRILTLLSYLGCGVSSVFLSITLLTYLAFEKVRRDYPSKILINLSAALLGLSMMFLLNSWLSSFSDYGLCIATAALLHYFMLASFTWMGLEAVHMYLALVKVFNIYVSSYMLKLCSVGWGIPLLIVSLVLAINKDAYGNALPAEIAVGRSLTEQFCWLQLDVFFYVTVVAFIVLVLLCNICVFIVVLVQIRRMKANKSSENGRMSLRDLRTVASLTVLLGLTWITGFFSFGPGRVVLIYLFTIFNSLQGLFIFVFHCLMKENVRNQWRAHLCCRRFRLGDYSDRGQTETISGPSQKNHHGNSDSVASDNTTVRKISDSSADQQETVRTLLERRFVGCSNFHGAVQWG